MISLPTVLLTLWEVSATLYWLPSGTSMYSDYNFFYLLRHLISALRLSFSILCPFAYVSSPGLGPSPGYLLPPSPPPAPPRFLDFLLGDPCN